MHTHSFREITEHFPQDMRHPKDEDEIVHVFECECGFTMVERKRNVKFGSGKKKTIIYTIVKKEQTG